jgi:glutamate racemase
MTNPDSLSAPKSAKTVPPVIGVFDSGAGGLTVLRALRALLPEARYIYLGDTARLPYGSKSQQTVARFAIESARFLAAQGAECLVIACNTASALALPEIRDAVSPVPVFGVIEAGADIARERSISGDVCVLATPATVASRAYTRACRARGLRTTEKACPLLVPLVEEGWIAHAVTRDVLRIYLAEAAAQAENAGLQPDTLLLGCTHYPLLGAEIEALVPAGTVVIDSAEVTADAVVSAIAAAGYKTASSVPRRPAGTPILFYVTDGPDRFRALGSRFLEEPIPEVHLIDLGG